MRQRGWHLICVYIALEACLNVSARSFQLFNAWYFLKVHSDPGHLALILTSAWAASTAVLPFAGVIAERVPKKWIVIAAALSSTSAATLTLAFTLTAADPVTGGANSWFVYLLCATTLSVAAAAISPLAISLLPSLGAGEAEVSRGLRLRSSMFIVNLLLGPILAGAAIGQFGGEAALVLQVIASCVGLALALLFARNLRASAQPPRSVATPSVLKDIRWGFRRVLSIPAERTIGMASLLANLLYVPFLTLLLPAKVLGHGYSMLDLAIIELAMGAGILLASAWGIPWLAKVVSQHTLASLGIASLGGGMICFSLVSRVELLCALALLMGAGISTFNVTVNTRRALSIPDGFRSAMESSLLFVCTLAVPFGLALSQQALLRTTPDGVIAAGGAVFCAAVLFIICSQSLRRMLNATDTGPYYQRLYADLFVR